MNKLIAWKREERSDRTNSGIDTVRVAGSDYCGGGDA